MVFSSSIFLFLFLPLCFLLYFAAPRLLRNPVLLMMSLFFYAWGEGYLVLIMMGSIAGNHILGRVIKRNEKKSKAFLILGITLNIGLLAFYKYLNFFLIETHINAWSDIHLPIGISFFTFQSVSYLVDIYRKRVPFSINLLETATYISFFPQLIAGPIVRFNTIALQIKQRKESVFQIYHGACRFITGLGKKVLIANPLGAAAESVFDYAPDELGPLSALLGLFCFSFQIYFDFSGYSDMAIGLGRVFGFRLPENFNLPYAARSIKDFWRRWHITLSEWFRDYLYIPLGGSQKGKGRTYVNLLIVFTLCGLWHGANWTFLIWGLWHGLFLILERIVRFRHPRWLSHLYVTVVVGIGWVFFNSPDLTFAGSYIQALFGLQAGFSDVYLASFLLDRELITLLILAAVLSVTYLPVLQPLKRKALIQGPFVLIILAFSILSVANGAYNPFLYFQF